MANWTTQDVLEQIQDLVGEPSGSYYNLSSRLRQLNQAQREMVEDTRALTETVTIPLVAGEVMYDLPDDFLSFSKKTPHYEDSAARTYLLKVTDVAWMDTVHPGWGDATPTGVPQHLIMSGPQKVQVWPLPVGGIGNIVVTYVVDPPTLSDFDDPVFGGYTDLNRFAPALAFKVAAMYMMARAPTIAQQYMALYNTEIRKMRSHVRSNPQHHQVLRPVGYRRRQTAWSD